MGRACPQMYIAPGAPAGCRRSCVAPRTTTRTNGMSPGRSISSSTATSSSCRTVAGVTTQTEPGRPTCARPKTAMTPSSGSASSHGATAASAPSAFRMWVSPRSCRRHYTAPMCRRWCHAPTRRTTTDTFSATVCSNYRTRSISVISGTATCKPRRGPMSTLTACTDDCRSSRPSTV